MLVTALEKLYEAALGFEFLHELGVRADRKGGKILIREDGRATYGLRLPDVAEGVTS
ncbi:hypothetical protein F441_02749 [Phytophthora nicotianae CJ01A1]|uniref:Uncharacterized protein n=4 Tax=Phytophthora nicotianae TaxID=4792 RepID=V9EDI3_PHYNI|nr:hypothetical protein F443_17375 [Phytophthora nicotianae P1569]ETO83144.1 hypothetical protein F444_02780 [Phytophthora nicotianae P1976]ETP24214.1 hypothetical protein F441_02749 [Phytophthora nicotianae CJ01A1]